ncbi:hypothetical protein PSEUDO8O_50208 [Pseudomonas sp. 8O]|nr:hypothetical protein PSEUDO8O_50208 [Pseudomonas sp. 8O]
MAGFPETCIHRSPHQREGARPGAANRGRGHGYRVCREGRALVVQSPAAEATAGLRDCSAGSDRDACAGPGHWGEHEKKRRFTTGHEGEVRRRLCREGGGRRWLPGARE